MYTDLNLSDHFKYLPLMAQMHGISRIACHPLPPQHCCSTHGQAYTFFTNVARPYVTSLITKGLGASCVNDPHVAELLSTTEGCYCHIEVRNSFGLLRRISDYCVEMRSCGLVYSLQ